MAVAGKDRGRGRLFVIAAPSGAGKTSLVKALLERRPELHVSISHTTRPMRPTEVAGREYYFVTKDQFLALRAKDAFLESAQVFDNYYGTSREPVEQQLIQGRYMRPLQASSRAEFRQSVQSGTYSSCTWPGKRPPGQTLPMEARPYEH